MMMIAITDNWICEKELYVDQKEWKGIFSTPQDCGFQAE